MLFLPASYLSLRAGAAKRTAPDDLNPEAWPAGMQAKNFSYVHMIDPTVKRMGQRSSGVVLTMDGCTTR